MMWNLVLLMMACESSPSEIDETEIPFRTACMGDGTPDQQTTTKALLEFIGETKCYAAWEKLSKTKFIDLESHDPPISDISVLEGLTQLETLFIGDSLIPDIDVIHGFVNLTDLRITNAEVFDLQPLSKLTKLETLIIDYTEVQDLKALEGLSKLKMLSIRGTKVSDFSSIQNLTTLKHLDASKTQIVQLEGIEKLSKMKILSLRGTPVQEIKNLSGLNQLQYLDLYETQIVSISPLENLNALEVLDISFTQVSDLSPLSQVSTLQEFKAEAIPVDTSTCPDQPEIIKINCQQKSPFESPFLMTCMSPEGASLHTALTIESLKSAFQIQDCTALYQNLQQQENIQLLDSAIYDVNIFKEFDNLSRIELDRDTVYPRYCPRDSEHAAISSFCTKYPERLPPDDTITAECTKSLESQDSASPAYIALIDILSVEDCSDLSTTLPVIDRLEFDLLELNDISPLKHAINLRELYLGKNNIQDISSLSELQKLQILWLDNNQITDISSLSNDSLIWLSLGDNQIKDITSLKTHTQLVQLWLGGNQIQDISPLANLTHLRKLHLAKNAIQNIEPLSALPHLEKVYLADNQIKDPSPLLSIKQLRLLNEGLDYQESPLEAARWFLTNNPIEPSFCETPSLPFLFQFYCSTYIQ